MANEVDMMGEHLPSTVNVVHQTPKSPLLFDALSEKNFSLAEALIDENRGLKFISAADENNSVLHTAVIHHAPLILIQKLLDKGADPNQPNLLGRTPVYLAARHNARVQVIKLLLRYGGNINSKDRYQYTPLMSAAYNRASLTLVGALLSLGAQIDAEDQYKRTARDWAVEDHNAHTAIYLDEIMLIPILCSVYSVKRVGSKSLLKMLPKDMIRLVRDMLVIPSQTKKSRED